MHSVEPEHESIIVSVRGQKRQGSRIRAAASVRVDRRKIQRSLVHGGELAKAGDVGRANRIDAQERRAAEVSRVDGIYLEMEFVTSRSWSWHERMGFLNRREEQKCHRPEENGSEDQGFCLSQTHAPV